MSNRLLKLTGDHRFLVFIMLLVISWLIAEFFAWQPVKNYITIISPRQFGIENYAFFVRLDVQLRGRTAKRLLDFRHQKAEVRSPKSAV